MKHSLTTTHSNWKKETLQYLHSCIMKATAALTLSKRWLFIKIDWIDSSWLWQENNETEGHDRKRMQLQINQTQIVE